MTAGRLGFAPSGRKSAFTGIGLTALAVLSAAAQAQRRLPLAEAVSLAQTNSPLARQAAARVASAEARLRSGTAHPSPLLSLAQPFGKGTGGLDEDILLVQTFGLGGKRLHEIRSLRAERDAALAEKQQTAVELAYGASSAYFDALRADSERQLAADSLAAAKAFADAAEIQFQAGDVPRSNVLRSQIELFRAQQALAAAETERANKYAALRSVTGLPSDSSLDLTDKLDFAPAPYRLANLLDLGMKRRPDVRAAALLRDARAAALRQARSRSQPDLFAEARHSTLDPTVGGSSIRVGITFPLFDLGRASGDVRAAQAALAEQEAALAETTRTARLDIETAFRNLEQAQNAVESFQAGRLDRSKELLTMAQIGYERGANSYLELLDAQQVYRTEQGEYAKALAAFNTAKAALEKALGGKLP